MPGLFQNINGSGIFNGNSKNGGSVTNGIFNGNATNTGNVDKGVFQGKSKNQGTANTAYVGPNATNEGTINNTLSDNNVNKITHPTGVYVWVDSPPPHGVPLWTPDDYVDAEVAGMISGIPYTLPPETFIQVPELGDAYWGIPNAGEGYTELMGVHQNQPRYQAVCSYMSDGAGGYYIRWPVAGTSIWSKVMYRLRYNADNNFTLPPVSFLEIPELGDAYWGIDPNIQGQANQPPYDAVCVYESDGAGSYLKRYPPRHTTLWDSWTYKLKSRSNPNLTIPNAEFVQIPELGDAYWGIQDDARPDSFLQGLPGQPPWRAVASYIAGGGDNFFIQWTHWGTSLWDETIYKYRVDNNSAYTLPAAAFMPISELGDVYWGPYPGIATGIENQPPIEAVANYRTSSQPGAPGQQGGTYIKRYKVSSGSTTVLWSAAKYTSMLSQRPTYALSESAFVNIPELGDVYWTGNYPNQPPLVAIAKYVLMGSINTYVQKQWPEFDTVLWNYSNYTAKLATNPSTVLPEDAYITIPEIGDAYWTGSIPGQPPLVSIATYKSNEQGGFYRSWALAGVDLWGPDEYEAKLGS